MNPARRFVNYIIDNQIDKFAMGSALLYPRHDLGTKDAPMSTTPSPILMRRLSDVQAKNSYGRPTLGGKPEEIDAFVRSGLHPRLGAGQVMVEGIMKRSKVCQLPESEAMVDGELFPCRNASDSITVHSLLAQTRRQHAGRRLPSVISNV